MKNTEDLKEFLSRDPGGTYVEYIFVDVFKAYNFIDTYRDKMDVNESVWLNDDGSYSVMVKSSA